ncbi:class I SAM-dependent methyltransferase [Thalassobaculum fulvum]|nr:class I SAM-dependent methyltransferase [Thalassobaculum fulvum]
MSAGPAYLELMRHYEACLDRHGDSHRGVDWPNPQDAETRYAVMLDLLAGGPDDASLLDVGCGAGHLLEHIRRHDRRIAYTGLDISPAFVELCRRKFPEQRFLCLDLLADDGLDTTFDYVVMNGVFTERVGLADAEMWDFFTRLVERAFDRCRLGIAFNVMSKHVDWERADLFHVSYDRMAEFVGRRLSRHYRFRADYGLYEFTTYVFRAPNTA